MNIAQYIGLPYQVHGVPPHGADCWSLARHFAKNELGISLPVFFYDELTLQQDSARNIIREMKDTAKWVWKDAPDALGDIILFNLMGYPVHTGIYLGDGDFLHTLKGRNSSIERLTDASWRNRITGVAAWKQG
jgi:cell wall-associated NlpC family hydrolase